MTQNILLPERLKRITQFLPKGSFFADIGSDHAYLPIAVCQMDPTAKAIAGELNEGPFQAAIQHVKQYGLADQIEVIKGDGLAVIQDKKVKQVVIAGMGGGLIRSILEAGKAELDRVERLILQPNVDSQVIRAWLMQTDYRLVEEEILTEDGHTYEILVADKIVDGKPMSYTEQELLFGPFLLKKRHQVFVDKWNRELTHYQRIITQIKQAKVPDIEKIEFYERQISWIEEVLSHE